MDTGKIKKRFSGFLQEIFVDKYNCLICDDELQKTTAYGLCLACFDKLEFIKDGICKKCGRKQSNEADFCLTCQEHKRCFDFARSCVVYNDMAKELVRGIKFGHKKYFGKYLSAYLIDRYKEVYGNIAIDCIVPVPLSKERRKERGYNQAEIIARYLAEAIQIPLDSTLVEKVLPNKEQAKLSGKEREENVVGVYEVARKEDVTGKNILIVDDVMTTGSTLSELARILKQAKANEVFALTFASTSYKTQGETLVLEEDFYEDQMV